MPKIQQKVTSNRTRISPFSKNESQKQFTPRVYKECTEETEKKKKEMQEKKELALKKKQEKEKEKIFPLCGHILIARFARKFERA